MNVQTLPSGGRTLRIRFDNQLSVLTWNQTGWGFDDYSVIANPVFERYPAVDAIEQIVDVTLILGSECAEDTHRIRVT